MRDLGPGGAPSSFRVSASSIPGSALRWLRTVGSAIGAWLAKPCTADQLLLRNALRNADAVGLGFHGTRRASEALAKMTSAWWAA